LSKMSFEEILDAPCVSQDIWYPFYWNPCSCWYACQVDSMIWSRSIFKRLWCLFEVHLGFSISAHRQCSSCLCTQAMLLLPVWSQNLCTHASQCTEDSARSYILDSYSYCIVTVRGRFFQAVQNRILYLQSNLRKRPGDETSFKLHWFVRSSAFFFCLWLLTCSKVHMQEQLIRVSHKSSIGSWGQTLGSWGQEGKVLAEGVVH
jgi:hypothetical protein